MECWCRNWRGKELERRVSVEVTKQVGETRGWKREEEEEEEQG
ncbi:hypothetical protein E2C01_085227 [Portunus trituberculatus]|uniref:Uncharacterized protein n=1 Tax=Portunus trituberculatus TaxID=210409 RepID=A0A5B7IXB2_PORTR|nr:hypothetical protein [Portunus trituberculatus]